MPSTEQVDLEDNEVVEEEDIRDSIASAFDDAVADDDSVAPADTVDDSPVAEAPLEKDAPAPETKASDDSAIDSDDKAPASWTPAAREEWANTPKTVQETSHKREREMQSVMQESAHARQHMNAFSNMIQPFQPMFQAQGVRDPMQGVYDVLQTSAKLQGGTPAVKAATMAQLIKQFGVSITDLDNELVGNPIQDNTPPQDPRFAQLSEQVAGMQSYFNHQNQSAQNDVNTETNAFLTENEFANDLRQTMADFMDQASNQNQRLSLDEAYQRAIATRPDIQEILSNRKKVDSAGRNVRRARGAGVAIPISSDGSGVTPPPVNLRAAIADAFDNG